MTESVLHHRIRQNGAWQVLLPGVYLSSTGTATSAQREMAPLLYVGPGAAITGPAALVAHGIRAPETAIVDVLVPAERKRRDIGFVRVQRTSRMPNVVYPVGAIRYAPPVRAMAGTARTLRDVGDVRAVVASAVQWRKVHVIDLAGELAGGPAAGSALLRAVLAEVADGGVRSAVEADLRTLIKRARLPDPLYNPRLYVGEEFIATPDAWWPAAGVAVEVDSREWHLSPQDWERTLARHSRMSAHGIIVLHYPPSRLHAEPRVVMAEIKSALEAGRARRIPALRAVPAR